jgi:predicted metal-binding membrane protein
MESGTGSEHSTRSETRLGAGFAVAQHESERRTMPDLARASGEARRFSLAIGSLILAAWGLLAAWNAFPYAVLLDGEHAGARGSHAGLALVLLSWIVMTVAMMLPGELPQLHWLRQQIQHQVNRSWLATLFVLGYLVAWALFGALVGLGQAALYALAGAGAPSSAPSMPVMFICELPRAASPDLAAAAILLVAGIYQLTPTKRERLEHCRSRYGQTQTQETEAWTPRTVLRRGVKHGGACVGNCWALMLCMVAFGMSLEVMLALGSVMTAERASPWGRLLVRPLGLGLMVFAIIIYRAR